MFLTIADIQSNDIYLESRGTLATRMDYAWSVYLDEIHNMTDRKKALQFLIDAFNLSDLDNINAQIIKLMQEREAYKTINPDYIPGKSPKNLPFNPGLIVPQQTPNYGEGHTAEIIEAIKQQELLDVNDDSKYLDKTYATKLLSPEQRAAFRVHIKHGIFVKDNNIFSTDNMISHLKPGYASYTLNSNGEFHLFNHLGMADKMAHSSMNAGAPVVAAGELRILQGQVTMITTHSGHYRPSIFTVYRVLEHLINNGVDISETEVATVFNPDLKGITVFQTDNGPLNYKTPAAQIYKQLDKILEENVLSINEQIKSYREGGFVTCIFTLKDKITGSTLTKDRADLAEQFEAEVSAFKKTLASNMTPAELDTKIGDLKKIISKYNDQNQSLSVKANKSETSGRLSISIGLFSERLKNINQEVGASPDMLKQMKDVH
jgi:hypothetical protein